MPSLVSQAVSQSVNNIYWVPNERGCHETGRRQGLWPWGAARTMMESEKRKRHAHRKLEKQCLTEQSTRAIQGVGSSPLLSPDSTGTLASLRVSASLLGTHAMLWGKWFQFLQVSVFLNWLLRRAVKVWQSQSGCSLPHHAGGQGHWRLTGEAGKESTALATYVWGSSPFQALPHFFFKVRFLMKGRTMKFLFSDLVEEMTEESVHIWF